jgi:hypothetical protein
VQLTQKSQKSVRMAGCVANHMPCAASRLTVCSGRDTVVFVRLSLALAACFGCGPTPTVIPDTGPPPVLEALDPPGTQIGLQYGKSETLRVHYHFDDDNQTPIIGAKISFALVDDDKEKPQGSTLGSASATTDSNGIAQVDVTAGQIQTHFRVTASALRVPDLLFNIAVSEDPFVAIDVQLTYTGPGMGGVLRALLYEEDCSALMPQPTAPPAERELTKAGVVSATLSFINLLSLDYSIVGRAESPEGRLYAQACAHIPKDLLPPGSNSTLPLNLQPVVASPLGQFNLTSVIQPVATATTPATDPWHALIQCAASPAQNLLDQLMPLLPSSIAAVVDANRGVLDVQNCRGAQSGGGSSIDQDLQTLLTPAGAPATELTAIVADLDHVVQSASLGSMLVINDRSPSFSATHTLTSLQLGSTTSDATYMLGDEPLPVVSAREVAVTYAAPMLSIGPHGFTLHLPHYWQRAFEELALLGRYPTLTAPVIRSFLGLMVQAAQRNGKSGCGAVEDLVCSLPGQTGCAGTVAAPCSTALDNAALALQQGFTPTSGLDAVFTAGTATATDSDGNLVVDTLDNGSWTLSWATATFSGLR